MNHSCIDILYIRFYDSQGEQLTLGGIQTYIIHLTRLFVRLGLQVRIFHYGEKEFHRQYEGADVYGIVRTCKHNYKDLYYAAKQTRQEGIKYITLFGTDDIIPNFNVENSIAIQHGVSWDRLITRDEWFITRFIKTFIFSYIRIKHLHHVSKIICVDHNFICWYRTQDPHRHTELVPILNFTRIAPKSTNNNTSDKVNIVFARRLFEYRGTRIFADAIKQILSAYPNVKVTIAGTGPEEEYMHQQLDQFTNITFTQYNANDSIAFHSQFDIAVVPTTGSEGTSLSLLEAMSAHCVPVCTNVGGMTNIVIDGFNGMMISPKSEELTQALTTLINNPNLRQQLSNRAYETVKNSFSLERWEEQWTNVIKELLQ